MTIEEKIQLIIANADKINYPWLKVIQYIKHPEASFTPGLANALRKIGIEDERIDTALKDF